MINKRYTKSKQQGEEFFQSNPREEEGGEGVIQDLKISKLAVVWPEQASAQGGEDKGWGARPHEPGGSARAELGQTGSLPAPVMPLEARHLQLLRKY